MAFIASCHYSFNYYHSCRNCIYNADCHTAVRQRTFHSVVPNQSNRLIHKRRESVCLVKSLRNSCGLCKRITYSTVIKSIRSSAKNFLASTLSFFSSISNVITQIVNLLIIPFLTFYLLKDFPTILKTFR